MFLRNVTLDILQTLQQRSIQFSILRIFDSQYLYFYLEFLLDSIAASAIKQPHLTAPGLLVTPQMFPDGGCVKGRDHPGLPALAPGAD